MIITSWQNKLTRWQLDKPVLLLIGLWLLLMIFVPIAQWTQGDELQRTLVVISVGVQALAVGVVLGRAWGWKQTAVAFLIITPITFGVEWVGSHTGFIFGDYSYTPHLQPQIAGVPLLIPVAWFMMLPCAWAVCHRWRNNPLLFAIMSGLALTAWDLFLDPQMVQWDLWVWHEPGLYFGIPLQNFVGWWATGTLLTLIIHPSALPIRPLWLIYALTWFLEWFGLAFFWGLVGPAIVGFFGMGVFLWLGWQHQ